MGHSVQSEYGLDSYLRGVCVCSEYAIEVAMMIIKQNVMLRAAKRRNHERRRDFRNPMQYRLERSNTWLLFSIRWTTVHG